MVDWYRSLYNFNYSGCAVASDVRNVKPPTEQFADQYSISPCPTALSSLSMLIALGLCQPWKFLHPLFQDWFSHRTDMFAVAAAKFIAEGTANILVNCDIPL